jgi:ligand-binding sensor domain-containing protein
VNKLLATILVILLFSCREESQDQTEHSSTVNAHTAPTILTPGKDTMQLPVVIPAGEPKIITIPTVDGGFYLKKKKNGSEIKIELKKPTTSAYDTFSPQGIPHFTNFTTNDGLALDAISCSVIDKTGNLWFGTSGGGVSKYDGKNFTNYTTTQGLANNNVFSICEDIKGNLWFGTLAGGVSRYDGKNFTNYTTTQGLANNGVWAIIEDKAGNLWFGTDGGGVSKYDGRIFTNYTTAQGLANNVVFSITEDETGNMWFGTYRGGVNKFDGKTFTNYTTAQGLANNTVWSIGEDKTGKLWFGTDGGGVSRFDGKTFTNYTTSQGLANNVVKRISEDKTGNLWFGTDGGGVSRHDGKTFTNFTTAQGLANNGVWTISEDRTGNLWFGTDGGGVSRYDGGAFTNYTMAQGLPNNGVFTITEDKSGNLWFGTYAGGVSRYDGKSFTNYSTEQGLAYDGVWSMAEDNTGNLWFGTYGHGVCRYDGKTFTNYTMTQGLAYNGVFCITEDRTGNIWFGTSGGGVSKYDGETFTNYSIAQGLANNVVLASIEDNTGLLWFGTSGGGVSRFNGINFTNYTTAQGLASNIVLCITEDKTGNIWFGTDGGGVSRYDGKTFANYTTAQGLPDDVVTNIVCDRNQKSIVFSTNFGVAVGQSFTPKLQYKNIKKQVPFQNNLSNEELSRYYDLVLETYNSATGYPIKDVNTGQNSLFQDSKGIYWAGTGSDATALVRIDFNALNRNPKPPTPVLYNIKINEENICFYSLDSKLKNQRLQGNGSTLAQPRQDSIVKAQQEIITYGKQLSKKERDSLLEQFSGIEFDGITEFYPIPQNLVLPHEHNNITFEFNAVQLARSQLLNFQYMLEGYDKTWSPVLKKREASFGNINEGTYTFKLKAQYSGPDGNNEWSEVLTYSFTVLPPWYRTWWMYTFYIIFAITLIALIVWANGKRLRAKATELQVKVDEATHEIKEQKHLIEEKHREITDSINYAERIQRSFLATDQHLNDNLDEYFIYFKPKDIVSGDFYWSATLNNGLFALATADSTGHGVPGAIMSLLNITSLEKAIETLNKPNDILNATRKTIIGRLKKDGSAEGGKDGMDANLCVYDFKNMKLAVSAGNAPLWIIREKGLIEIKGDRFPIGKHDRDQEPFVQHDFDLRKGDVVYTFTDGFSDQFGGPAGKKFKYKQLQELLISIAHEPMSIQKQKLSEVFETWRGNIEQVDDVTIVGVRV